MLHRYLYLSSQEDALGALRDSLGLGPRQGLAGEGRGDSSGPWCQREGMCQPCKGLMVALLLERRCVQDSKHGAVPSAPPQLGAVGEGRELNPSLQRIKTFLKLLFLHPASALTLITASQPEHRATSRRHTWVPRSICTDNKPTVTNLWGSNLHLAEKTPQW